MILGPKENVLVRIETLNQTFLLLTLQPPNKGVSGNGLKAPFELNRSPGPPLNIFRLNSAANKDFAE